MAAAGGPTSIQALSRSSSFVFAGTVLELGASNLRAVRARPNLVLVRVNRALRVDPVLGDLRGRSVTLETPTANQLKPGEQAVFFTQSWIHGEEVAVREVARVEVGHADEVAAAVARLPELHLGDRLADAAAVVLAEVERTRRIPNLPRERRAPHWSEATLRVEETLKGDASGLRLLFPTSESHHWYRAPRFRRRQRGVFLLHAGDPHATPWLADYGLDGRVVTALDPADVQPESEAGRVRTLLRRAR
jgi:hypothetical protein